MFGVQRESTWIELFNQAIVPLDSGDPAEGARLLESAEMIFPGQRPEALINLGVTYSNQERIQEAIDAYGLALEIIRGPPHGGGRQRNGGRLGLPGNSV